MENYLVINGKEIELTEEQIKILSDKEEKKNIWNPERNEIYYLIDCDGVVYDGIYANADGDKACQAVANCCTDESLMEKRALQETLNRLLWRFALQNGWDDKLLKERCSEKWSIYYDVCDKEFRIDFPDKCIYSNINFISEEVAQRAIDEIIKPFIEKHPELMEGIN